MKEFWADLHVHTVLSPCGDLEMSPLKIIEKAAALGIDIIAITDHNTTRHCRLAMEIGKEYGVFVLPGAEINTKEEVHCLTFFENFEKLALFQNYLDKKLPDIMNDPNLFGYQVQVDREEIIVYEEKKLLFAGLDASIDEIEAEVHKLGGIFIPAHIDRQKNSLFSQLGFFPVGLNVDALEISRGTSESSLYEKYKEFDGISFIKSSDAHFIDDIGRASILLKMEELSFKEIILALRNKGGRGIKIK